VSAPLQICTTHQRGKEIVCSLALRGLDRVAEQAESALELSAERLAT